MNIPIEILREKFGLKNNENGSKIDPNQIKKSGTLTGVRTSLTVHKNNQINQARHFLNQNAVSKIKKLNETDNSVTYKRNIATPYGTKRSAVPHGIIQNQINRNTPIRLPYGKAPSLTNTAYGQKVIADKFKTATKLFQLAKQNQLN